MEREFFLGEPESAGITASEGSDLAPAVLPGKNGNGTDKLFCFFPIDAVIGHFVLGVSKIPGYQVIFFLREDVRGKRAI